MKLSFKLQRIFLLSIWVTAIGGRLKLEMFFLSGRLRGTLLPKERYGDSLRGRGSNTQPFHWEADPSTDWAIAAPQNIDALICSKKQGHWLIYFRTRFSSQGGCGHSRGVAGTAGLALEIPPDQQQSQIVLLAPHLRYDFFIFTPAFLWGGSRKQQP